MSILSFATKGSGSNDDKRINTLLQRLQSESFPFNHQAKLKSFWRLLQRILHDRPDLVVMEGTGLFGGLACMLGRILGGAPYVVSSGDAVAPFIAGKFPILGPPFGIYERLLCRLAAGFIGWTPYLVGRALTFGTPRAMTAAGWADFEYKLEAFQHHRQRIRQSLGIPTDAIVFGIVGSLVWNKRHAYCYGLELIRAIRMVRRKDVYVLVVGDGSGMPKLKSLAGELLGRTVLLPGSVPPAEVPHYMAAMDVGSLPQSVDGVGSFRYTTKISEYVAARVPVVTGEIPFAYDLDTGWLWRLRGSAPWDRQFLAALADLMNNVTPLELIAKRELLPEALAEFDRERQVTRATDFFSEILSSKME